MKRTRRGRGEGGVYQRADGVWCASLSLGYDGDGKRRRRRVYGRTKGEALERLAAIRQEAQAGIMAAPERITLAAHWRDWLDAKAADVRPSTIANYGQFFDAYIRPTFGGSRLTGIDYRQINAWLAGLDKQGLSRRTVGYAAYLLRACLDDAVRKGIVPANQARLAAKRPQIKEEARYLTPDELKRFLRACHDVRLGDAFIFAVFTGLRPGEWMGLTWGAIDWAHRRVRVSHGLTRVAGQATLGPPKTKAGKRILTVAEVALDALKRQKRRQAEEQLAAAGKWGNEWGLVFTTPDGRPLRSSNVRNRDFAMVCRAAEIEGAHPHTLRHTNASILIDAGLGPKDVAARLGHDDIRTTLQTYGHLFPGRDEKAADALDDFARRISVP